MFTKLRRKFLFLNMGITSAVMALAFAVIFLTTYSNVQAENEAKLHELSATVTIRPNAGDIDGQTEQTRIKMNYTPSFVVTVDKKGEILGIESVLDLDGNDYADAVTAALKKGGSSTIELSGRTCLYEIVSLDNPLAVNGADLTEGYSSGNAINAGSGNREIRFLDITDSQKTLQSLAMRLTLIGAMMLIVIFFISRYFANRSIRPLMKSWEKQRQFVADASHDLKTPLSVITANYDALMANKDETIRSQEEWLGYMKTGMDRMSGLIGSMLSLASIEDHDTRAESSHFDLSEVITETMDSMDAEAQGKGLRVSGRIEQHVIIQSDKKLIQGIFSTLYENAIKYSRQGGDIEVKLETDIRQMILSVKNCGAGIPAEDLPKIFDRFYRADASRTGEESGYGLGLSIAKAATEKLGGTLSAESIENEYTTFTLTIPFGHDTGIRSPKR
ncbi:MAG: HAMP domain-containing histidine kinase [Clostridiales Family XIII bacterium]|jgi:signal transduction histidine kinase|nr:HAMP domain-containing histidine kinase [Clostridiales Family XIII bacterium]